VFPLSFAAALGLDPLKMKAQGSMGMGSYNVPTYYENVTMRISFGSHVQEYPLYAGFTQGLEQQGVGLLGQFGFFDRFNVLFDRARGLFHVELPDPPKSATTT
jgi:hypothetical protein